MIDDRGWRLGPRLSLAVTGVLLLAFAALAPSASAATSVVCSLGAGAGNCNEPQGVAVDNETGRLFVADKNNNRVDVFDSEGHFEKAFGWGVADGKAEFEVCAKSCLAGLAVTANEREEGLGAGKGQFNRPTAIAVDNDPASPSRHDVYVVDLENRRIEKFDPEGNFILAFGGGVDKTVPGNLCTAASGHTCGAGSEGFGEGEFTINESTGETGIFVGVGPSGVVYVVDSKEPQQEIRLQRFEPSGAEIAPQRILVTEGVAAAEAMAVEAGGDFYVAGGGVTRKYEPGASTPIDEIDESAFALAVDGSNHLFAASFAEGGEGEGVSLRYSIIEYDASGTPLRRFGYGSFFRVVRGLAPDNAGTGIYAADSESNFNATKGSKILHIDFSPPGPIILPEPCKTKPGTLGNAKATLQAEVNPEGKATTYHFEYIVQQDFEENGNSFSGAHAATRLPELAAEDPVAGSDFHLHEASLEAALVPETEYRCRAIAANADLPGGVIGQEGTFTSLPPLEIGHTWATEVGTEAATLHAEVNPLGIPTSAYFEYVDEATYLKDIEELGPGHGFDHATKAPAGEPLDFGAGESFKAGEATISGLTPGTAYRYRIVATDVKLKPLGKEIPGPTEALRTFAPGEGGLPDGRAYELVSPGRKNSAEVAVPGPAGGLFTEGYLRIQAAAPDGKALTYTSWTSFGQPESAPGSSQYLSRRGEGSWETENISPFGIQRSPLVPPYRGFSADLKFSGMFVSQPSLTEDCTVGFDSLYLRDNETGALRCLTPEAPVKEGEAPLCLDYAGASEDGSRAFFAANASYAGAPHGAARSFSLYEWSAAEGLQPLSVLPGKSEAATPFPHTAFGQGGVGSHCSAGEAIVRHAISADGSRAFWVYAPEKEVEPGVFEPETSELLVRVEGKETLQLDKGTTAEGGGVFWGASRDGSQAFFTDAKRLKAGSSANPGEPDLYRYELPSKKLTDLTPAKAPADVRGVVGISEDGAYVYFVAGGVLSGEEIGSAGRKAEAGDNNLYLYHEGQIVFIGALSGSPTDLSVWETRPRAMGARVSPDGRHLAFVSTEDSERL